MWQHCHPISLSFPFIHSSIHQFTEYLLNTYFVSGTMGGTGDKTVSGIARVSPLDLTVWGLIQKSVTRFTGLWRKIELEALVSEEPDLGYESTCPGGRLGRDLKGENFPRWGGCRARMISCLQNHLDKSMMSLFPTLQEPGLPDIKSSPSLIQLPGNQPIPP